MSLSWIYKLQVKHFTTRGRIVAPAKNVMWRKCNKKGKTNSEEMYLSIQRDVKKEREINPLLTTGKQESTTNDKHH